jgi:hypothetical protein
LADGWPWFGMREKYCWLVVDNQTNKVFICGKF